ncbi:MAG: hypothetical protein HC812_02335 [Leptolyngbya sp. RL_3_1]|nr:hypothetical protein [Leptolyngbya sp. RL_3_1]
MKQTNGLKDIDEGWRVQVYDRDRRLICLLEPSHGWVFFFGCVTGFLIAVAGLSRTVTTPPPSPAIPSDAPPLQID